MVKTMQKNHLSKNKHNELNSNDICGECQNKPTSKTSQTLTAQEDDIYWNRDPKNGKISAGKHCSKCGERITKHSKSNDKERELETC